MNRLFPKGMKARSAAKLEHITIRNFGGGLNTADDDLSMDPRFQPVLEGMRRTPSGAQAVEWGSKYLTNVNDVVSGNIINSFYFNATIFTVTTDGEIAGTDEDGVNFAVWNEAIANALPGAPSGWSTGLTIATFVEHKDKLIVHNGIDKPITIDSDTPPNVEYLHDEATGSNVNVPIGKYGCVVSNYHCVAGIAAEPTVIEISSTGTAGTFIGDPDPNDSIAIDVGAFAPEGTSDIRGVAGFRANLIVFFRGHAVVIKLGGFNDAGDHTPIFPDTFPRFGILGNRMQTFNENDLLFGSLDSVATAKRNLFSVEGLIESDRETAFIEKAYRNIVGGLGETESIEETFMANHRLSRDILLVTPEGGFIYSFDNKRRYKAWSVLTGPIWSSACTTFLGRLFLTQGTRIYQLGNDVYPGENYHAHKMLDRDFTWTTLTSFAQDDIAFDSDTGESYLCLVGHISGAGTFAEDRELLGGENPHWELYEGDAITGQLETPWMDGRNPMQTKQLKFISIGTKGTAEFTLKIYVDNLYKDVDGVVVHDPALEFTMIGNDAPGFGEDAGPYGGGRRSNDPRLFGATVKFKSIKFVFTFSVRKPLLITSLSALFLRGAYKR